MAAVMPNITGGCFCGRVRYQIASPLGAGRSGRFYSLPHLEREGVGPISTLPVSLRG